MRSDDDERAVDGRLLVDLDTLLARVPDAIPWAERSGNRVEFHESAPPERADDARDRPSGLSQLYDLCASISMADVDNGWFVHPEARADRDDEFIPRSIDGRGRCSPLGSDGVGGWLVVDDDGAVLLLTEGPIRRNRYEPQAADSVRELAGSVRALIAYFIERAMATVAP